ncbi:MAG: hypothetical protein HEQ23_10525 [Tepidisphaera sp.]
MITPLAKSPIITFAFLLLTRVAPLVVAGSLILASLASWIAYRELASAESGARWSGTVLTWLAVEATSVPMWLLLALVLAGTISVRRTGFARHLLDFALRIVARRIPSAETLRVTSTLPPEIMAELRQALELRVESGVALAPPRLGPAARWVLRRLARAFESALLNVLKAKIGPDGTVELMNLPDLIGEEIDRFLLRKVWLTTILVALATLAINAGLITGIVSLFGQFQPTVPPLVPPFDPDLEPIRVE